MMDYLRRWRTLYRDRYQRGFELVHINKTGGTSIEAALDITHQHHTALEIRDRIGRQRWNDRFTFTIVRNPWDRAVSQYSWRYRTEKTEAPTFDEWVKLAYEQMDPRYYYNPKMFMPQWFWIADEDGRNIVDFVGRFETLREDFATICARIGHATPLPHERPSEHAHYSTYYDDASRATIARWFAVDIDRFGYSFDTASEDVGRSHT
jgi:hypothetical protein